MRCIFRLVIPTDRPSPILYVFDPAARGVSAVEAVREAAEKYGYIAVASNNSRNGPQGGASDAVNAIFRDTHQRYAIDDRRLYTAGLSGGARLATQVALFCKTCIAGVIANGAGFPVNANPKDGFQFAYFLAIGNADFNFPEMYELRHVFEQMHANYRIHVFDGPHDWAPPEVWLDSLRWMNLQAIRSGNLPKDAKEIQQIFQEELEEARAAGKQRRRFDGRERLRIHRPRLRWTHGHCPGEGTRRRLKEQQSLQGG